MATRLLHPPPYILDRLYLGNLGGRALEILHMNRAFGTLEVDQKKFWSDIYGFWVICEFVIFVRQNFVLFQIILDFNEIKYRSVLRDSEVGHEVKNVF